MKKIVFYAAILMFAAAVYRLLMGCPSNFDFIQHWQYFREFIQRNNPYEVTYLVPLLSPPWILLIQAPFLMLPLNLGALLWFAANACAAGWIAWRAAKDSQLSFAMILSLAFFMPAAAVLFWGHVSMLVAIGIVGFFYTIEKKQDRLAGFFLALMTVKPHLAYLLIMAVMIWIIQNKRYRVLSWFLYVLGALGLVVTIWIPGSILSWLGMRHKAMHWDTPTLVTWTCDWWYAVFKALPVWPVFVFPGIAIVVAAVMIYQNRRHWSLHECQYPLVLFSIIFTPHAWFQDFVVLYPAYCSAVCRLSQLKSKLWMIFVLIIQVTAVMALKYSRNDKPLVFFPFLIAMLWLWGSKAKKNASA